jgi:hypothetical protein
MNGIFGKIMILINLIFIMNFQSVGNHGKIFLLQKIILHLLQNNYQTLVVLISLLQEMNLHTMM